MRMEACPNSGSSRSWLRGAVSLAVCLASLVSSCSREPSTVVAKLEVSGSGTYVLNGQPVLPTSLTEAMQVLRAPGAELLVHVVPAPNASYEAVQFAMAAVQKVGGQIGIVGNERF
jgi:biopolymer transport protein ExbD